MRKKSLKRMLVSCLCLALSLSFFAGCGSKSSEVESAVADGVLQVGILLGDDRFAALEEGVYVGVEPELMNRLAESLGVGVTFCEYDSAANLFLALEEGSIDVAIGRIPLASEYAERYLTSSEYGRGGIYLLTQKYDYTDTLAGFADETVGISVNITSLSRSDIPYLSSVNTESFSGLSQAVKDLESGTYSAVLVNEREALSALGLSADIQAQELLDGPKEGYGAFLAQGQTDLKNSLNTVISTYLTQQATAQSTEES